MIDRRTVLVGTAALAMGTALPVEAQHSAGKIRVAALKFGSFGWLLETIKAEGLDKKAGLEIDILDIATNQAGPVALLSREVDLIVSDWTWAMRQRSLGELVKFAPYSSALGALMVPKDAGFAGLGDLAGKRLGVAGSAIDKSWLLLRAYSRKTLGKDIAETAVPVFGAAPLITEELRGGRVDAALNFWTYAARLSSDRFVQLVGMGEILKTLGVEPVPSLVGYVWSESATARNGPALDAFLKVAEAGNAVLARSDAAWERLRPLVKPENDPELAAIKDYYRAGIPSPWTDRQTRSAEKLMGLLVEAGDKELMGVGTRFDANLFHAAS